MLRRTLISQSISTDDPRIGELRAWLDQIDIVAGAEPRPASSDASFRRYFRIRSGSKSYIVMDAPPGQEDCVPFMRIAGYLEAMQLNAPRVIEANPQRGFLLLTDLGSTDYLEELTSHPEQATALYADALQSLVLLQRRGAAYQSLLPPYDEKLLRFELSLFHDWFCGTHLGLTFSDEDEKRWQQTCDVLVQNALDQPAVFVHRDYHSRNLMRTDADNPGILDFQDAVEGPLTYDLVSLLEDSYVRWPAERVRNWACDYYAMLDASLRNQVNRELFLRYFYLMAVQRHLKVAGIFARLNHRDGKPVYLDDIPRTLDYIVDLELDYGELGFIVDLVRTRCLPALRDGT